MSWWIWLIAAIVIGVIELSTVTFVLLWFAVAAGITTVLSLVVTNPWWQFALFAVIGLALYFATRPLARRWRQRPSYPERTETMVGKAGVVVTGEEAGGFATVRIDGELWSARSDERLLPGDPVVVTAASTTVVTVRRAGEGTSS
ncbi:MAG: NfeD family protein [Alicyclobacillus sp.]|nr:NfeD family protein [Alicyclobacillus sp.]